MMLVIFAERYIRPSFLVVWFVAGLNKHWHIVSVELTWELQHKELVPICIILCLVCGSILHKILRTETGMECEDRFSSYLPYLW